MTQSQIAESLARKAHEGEFRRDGFTPYIRHVERVVEIVKQRGGGEMDQAIAWLHDCIECKALCLADLVDAGLGVAVIYAVSLLTLNKTLSYEANINYLKHNKMARQVKIADNLANLSDSPTDKQIMKYAKSLQILMSGE